MSARQADVGVIRGFLDAADYLDTHGWCRGAIGYGGPGAPKCINGALREVAEMEVAQRCANQFVVVTGYTITGFNDTVCTGAPVAVKTLREVATIIPHHGEA